MWKAAVAWTIYQLATDTVVQLIEYYIKKGQGKKRVLGFMNKISGYKIILRLMKTLIGKLFSNILFREL